MQENKNCNANLRKPGTANSGPGRGGGGRRRLEASTPPDGSRALEQSRAAARREAARVLLPGIAPGRKIDQRGVKQIDHRGDWCETDRSVWCETSRNITGGQDNTNQPGRATGYGQTLQGGKGNTHGHTHANLCSPQGARQGGRGGGKGGQLKRRASGAGLNQFAPTWDAMRNAKGTSLGEPRGGCRGNRPGRAPLPGPLSKQSKNPSRQSLGREQPLLRWRGKVALRALHQEVRLVGDHRQAHQHVGDTPRARACRRPCIGITILMPRISSQSVPTAKTSIIDKILMMSIVILVATGVVRVVPIMSSELLCWHYEGKCAMQGASGLPMATIHNYVAIQVSHQVVDVLASRLLEALAMLLLQQFGAPC
ncbi:unnamed protein product [Prorocentrum cordatum]|uniref:Uncharacterized protein n=1 Tax=Prorocentrum cordatum TaxID=2364126 RepID=A0ABN9SCR7_9DINO|nr:unnamed protein product [Polarella glacialis]